MLRLLAAKSSRPLASGASTTPFAVAQVSFMGDGPFLAIRGASKCTSFEEILFRCNWNGSEQFFGNWVETLKL